MRMCFLSLTVAALLFAPSFAETPMPGLVAIEPEKSAAEIIAAAHEAAGGATWKRPKSLLMSGYAIFYSDGKETRYEPYLMARVFVGEKNDAHAADGKVRIEAKADGETAFLIAFDGATTYDINGPLTDQSANARWSANFGFGAIRHALDEGWSQKRLADDLVDGRLAYLVELTDPAGGATRFAISQDDYSILYVGFDTPRGWHERRYSDFFSKDSAPWMQPGRVRLYYDGVKQNEVIWTDFEINSDLPDDLFTVGATP